MAKSPHHLRARWALVDLLRRDPSTAGGNAALTHLYTLLKDAPRNVVVCLALARELLERGELRPAVAPRAPAASRHEQLPLPRPRYPGPFQPSHSDGVCSHTRFVTPEPFRDRMRP